MTDVFAPTHPLMERYLQRRLSGEEEAAFETWLLDNPGAVQELEYLKALQEGVKALGPPEDQVVRRTKLHPRKFAWFNSPRQVALAATVALAVVAVPIALALRLASHNDELTNQLARLGRPSDTVVQLPLELTRGIETSPVGRIALQPEPYTVILQIPVTAWASRFDQFEVVLTSADAEYRFSRPNVSTSGFIQVALNSAILRPGTLQIALGGDGRELATFRVAIEE